MGGASAQELYGKHLDADWRARFADIVDLMDLLADCLIRDDYTVPDQMNTAIALTDAGSEIKSRLIRREQVSAKEAHLMCALTLGHDALFIDVEGTDIDALVASISEQIIEGEIRFPFIYGRDLYDAYAGMFDEVKEHLSNEETGRLLDSVPPGVFQYGRFVVGPSGLRSTRFRRTLTSSRHVPAYHCDDPVCRDLHTVILSTGHNAAINAQRGKLERLLQSSSASPADWSGLASEITRIEETYFGNSWTAPLATLVGDCLGDDELVELHGALSGHGSLPGYESRAKFLEDLLVSFPDRAVGEAIDQLVQTGGIVVPAGEVRRPITTSHLRSGVFRLQPQLGASGLRFTSGDPGLPTLRERDLFRRIYLEAGEAERDELDWQLRGIDGVSIEVRLDEYLRTVAPPDALTRLVLSGRASAIAASELAGAGDFDGSTDEEIIRRLLWKLGFDDRVPEDRHSAFWRQHERLSATVQSWLGTGVGDVDDYKGMAAVYFTKLEGLLAEALSFATWALLFDHTSSPKRFTYDPDRDQAIGFELLDRYLRSESVVPAGESLRYTGRLTMHPLARGFGVLAEVLKSVRAKRDDFRRPQPEFPKYARLTALQDFPFQSVLPFLDISEHSQARLIAGVAEIEDVLQTADVVKVRNEYSHYRRTSPEVAQMVSTLEAVGKSVRSIENLGFGLNLFAPAGEEIDRWNRRVVNFAGPRSQTHSINRPSNLQWVEFPSLHKNQYLVRSAAFADANEVLRFERGYSSAFSALWEDYPRPRRSLNRIVEGAGDSPT